MKRNFCIIALIVLLSGTISVHAADSSKIEQVTNDVAQYVYSIVNPPTVGTVGGEWAVIGLSKGNYQVESDYFDNYYSNVEQYVKECDGVLHSRKYTEYSRVVLALTAIGKNPHNVGGYNLLEPLADYDKTVWQGINGPVWALIALDSGNYEISQNPMAQTQATREMYLNKILDSQLTDGGWVLGAKSKEESSDPDMTAMALCALSGYTYRSDVASAVERGINCLSAMQRGNGGFASMGVENSESCAQVLVAMCELGISQNDSRFVKNGKTVVDALLEFYKGNGAFLHTADSGVNQMATEQALYALAALSKAVRGEESLYSGTPVEQNQNAVTPEALVNPKVARMLNNMINIEDLLWRINK